MRTIDYRKFLDRNLIGHLPLIGGGLSLVVSDGVYRALISNSWLTGLLADLGVRTFGDLRTGEEPEQFAWSLVVTASDLSRRQLVRIPWDLESYGIDPDSFLRGTCGTCIVGDSLRLRTGPGGWRHVGRRWAAVEFPGRAVRPTRCPAALADVRDPAVGSSRHSAHPPGAWAGVVGSRSHRDAGEQSGQLLYRRPVHSAAHHLRAANDVSSIDFDITTEQREALYQQGLQAGQDFLKTWNFADYQKACGAPVNRSPQTDSEA